MFVDLSMFWWAVPLAVAGLPACFALYYGIAAALARRIGIDGIGGAMLFAVMWFLADEARGHLFTGFPWNLEGYAWSGVLPVLQVTSVIGIYGLTLLTLVAVCLPASLTEKNRGARAMVGASLLLFVGLAVGGEVREHSIVVGTVPDVRLRLVQPNIAQTLKWGDSEREKGFAELIDLSATPAPVMPTHIFWPETAATYYLSEDAGRRMQIADRIPSASILITGVIRRELDDTGHLHYFNSLVALNGMGQLVAGYDKAHLVPFGEFMPLRQYTAVQAVAASGTDFTPGPGVRSLRVLGLPVFSPLICYEVIFPGQVVDAEDRPDFMVNLTNDGWYGDTTGPYQHFAIARVRSIEEGLPLIRIANTGVSGVIDPIGRIVQRLGLSNRGFIDSDLPTALPPTVYAKYRNMPVLLEFLIFSLSALLLIFKKKHAAP